MRRSLAAALALGLWGADFAHAGRFIATPFAETIDKGRYSLWQFGLYDQRGAKNWRSLNRLDLGLWDGVELGVFESSPKNRPAETWVNAQVRPLAEDGYRPSVSLGAWDIFNKASPWFEDNKGASPFVSLGKGARWGERYLKAGLSYGFNRLHGLFGGLDARVWGGTGVMGEYVPRNLRLPNADKWDFGVYQWLGKYARVRASWMGGNPMVDAFFTYSFAQQGGKI